MFGSGQIKNKELMGGDVILQLEFYIIDDDIQSCDCTGIAVIVIIYAYLQAKKSMKENRRFPS